MMHLKVKQRVKNVDTLLKRAMYALSLLLLVLISCVLSELCFYLLSYDDINLCFIPIIFSETGSDFV